MIASVIKEKHRKYYNVQNYRHFTCLRKESKLNKKFVKKIFLKKTTVYGNLIYLNLKSNSNCNSDKLPCNSNSMLLENCNSNRLFFPKCNSN